MSQYSSQKSTESGRADSESDHRAVLLSVGRDALEVPLQPFFDKILPRTNLSPAQINGILNSVLDDPAVYNRDSQRWVVFASGPDTALAESTEDVPSAEFTSLFRAIAIAARACVPELEPRTSFDSMPTARGSQTSPDAKFVYIADDTRPDANTQWINIAVTGEYSSTTTINDDIRKVLWNMHHIMQNDARRRFTFAFTVDNRHARIWFANRSEVLVSQHFDFMREPELFIRMFLSFTYASLVDLGWDDTMTLHLDGDEPQYDITVQPFPVPSAGNCPVMELELRTFRTKELLSGAEHLRGRGTRVWAVNELIDGRLGEETFVLKDTWVDSTHVREGRITAEILQSVTNEDKAVLHSALLGTEIHGDVFVDGKVDCTLNGDFCGQLLNKYTPRFNFRQTTPTTNHENVDYKTTTRATVAPFSEHRDAIAAEESVHHHSRTHYRIVFKELCRPLYKVIDLKVILWMLLQASAALAIIHKLGWVHRDVSSGNLLLNEADNTVKIADWEYAKKVDSPGTAQDDRTGTEDFMAVEVAQQTYMFATLEDPLDRICPRFKASAGNARHLPVNLDTPEESFATVLEHIPKARDRAIWSYNPLHDMESIFWICVFYILFRDIHWDPIEVDSPSHRDEIVEGELQEKRERRARANYIFGHNLFVGRASRSMFIMSPFMLSAHFINYPLHPLTSPLGDLLIDLRTELVKKYTEVESNWETITHRCADGLHDIFVDNLYGAFLHVRHTKHRMKVRSLQAEVELLDQRKNGSQSSKRTRSDVDSEESGVDSHVSKAPRTHPNQSPQAAFQHTKSTHRLTRTPLATVDVTPTTVVPARALRSHTRKLSKIQPDSFSPAAHPPPPVLTRPSRTITQRRRRRAKEGNGAANEEGGTGAKSKSRKGR